MGNMNWKTTATLQGVGDPNCLVEVKPGALRFGLLRKGQIYKQELILRNLDVEATRFVVRIPHASEYVNIVYSPKSVASGLSLSITCEILAHLAAKIENIIEVRCKAHVIRIPVTATILECENYDSLDAESFLLRGKRL